MYTIIRSGDILKIGTDLVDATTGKLAAHGKLTVRRGNIDPRYCAPKELTWVSTASCAVSERVLRNAVKKEGQIITYFESQGV
jgi:hypothetical protein